MGEHRPEPTERLGGDAGAKLGDITLEVRTNELLAPVETDIVVRGETAVGEATTSPEPIPIDVGDLGQIEGTQFEMGNTASEGLG
jgi:hypothetical protein